MAQYECIFDRGQEGILFEVDGWFAVMGSGLVHYTQDEFYDGVDVDYIFSNNSFNVDNPIEDEDDLTHAVNEYNNSESNKFW